MQYVEINNVSIPALGLGTWQLEGQLATDMVANAIEIGYRHIDTAQIYRNEAEVGKGIRESGIPREELFVTTKVWPDRFKQGDLQKSVDESLERLQMDAVDLLLLHWPNPEVPLQESMAALNEVHAGGKAKNIGISNFTVAMIDAAVKLSDAKLLTNQVEYHALLDQSQVLNQLRYHNMALTAYSPLAQGKIFAQAELRHIADVHGKSPAQLALRWLIQQKDVMAIPRTSSVEHAKNNFAIFDFELTVDEMHAIQRLTDSNLRTINPDFAPDWD